MSGSRPQCSSAKKRPGAPEAGLHLVADEQRAVLAAGRLGAGEIAVGRQVDALALDRLDDEGGDVARARAPPAAPSRSPNGTALAAGQERPEALAEVLVAVERERAEREAVEGVLGEEDPRSPGRRARELDRALDRLGAGVGGAPSRRSAPARARRAPRRARPAAARRRAGGGSRCGRRAARAARRSRPGGCARRRRSRSRRAGRGSACPSASIRCAPSPRTHSRSKPSVRTIRPSCGLR